MNALSIVKKIIAIIFIVLFLRFAFFEVYQIQQDNLTPTISKGSYLFISKASYNIRLPLLNFEIFRWKVPAVGDLVAFFIPERGNERFVNRVVALAGSTVQIIEGKLLVDGAPFELQGLSPEFAPDFGPVRVPESHFFALNDHRSDLFDSRTYGPVPFACLKGKVKKIFK